ncbi:MAG: sulfotransferase [Gammaproteobacteria bacterium]
MAAGSSKAAVAQLFDTASRLHQEGQLQRAEFLYRDVLRQVPDHGDALNMLGVIGCQTGNFRAGADLIRRALDAEPDNPGFNNNLGMALLQMNDVAAAVMHFERAVNKRPRFAEAQFNLGNAHLAQGERDAAERHFRKALRVRADYPEALNNLGNLLRERGRAGEALPLLHKLARRLPDAAPVHFNLALAYLAQGQTDEAFAACSRSLELDTEQRAAWELLGDCQRRRGALAEAEAAYRRALDVEPARAETLDALGLVQFAQSRVEAARTSFEQARALVGESAQIADHLGMTWAASGDRDRASACFERAVSLDPVHAGAWRNLAELITGEEAAAGLLARIDGVRARVEGDGHDAAVLDFARGRVLDELGRFEQAFAAYRRANAVRRKAIRFERDEQSRFIDAMVEVFDTAFFHAGAAAAAPVGEQAVFIVGMPRSGTTLVEQIVASHRDVHGAGELTFFPARVPALARRPGSARPFPHCVRGNQTLLAELGTEYLAMLAGLGDACRRVSDKMPYNFLYLGAIAVALPRARVVHCRRDAMATCFSLFTHDLVGNHPYSHDFGDLAAAYVGYERLMRHWAETLPLAVLDVDYEALVGNPGGEARRMIEFLGLPWDDACDAFHRNARAVTTASQWAVRQPVYSAAKDHWQHYRNHLEPLREALERERRRHGLAQAATP